MKTMLHPTLCLRVALTALTLSLPALATAQYAYDITPLIGAPQGLNNPGQVVGYYYTDPQGQRYRAFEYSNGATTDLFPDTTTNNNATGINDSGQICGNNGVTGPFVYNSATGVTQSLGLRQTRPSDNYASAINQNGDVTGSYLYPPTSGSHAFIYSSSAGKFQDINPLGGPGGSSGAAAINNNGQAAGDFGYGNGSHAFLYSNGVVQDIGTLPNAMYTSTTGINDNGDVVGYATGAGVNDRDHAFLYHNGAMTDIGALYGSFYSAARDINNAGDIVGDARGTGFLYHNGQALYLNNLIDPALGWSIRTATAINEQGQIIGYGNRGGFLMTPRAVPAPGSLLTFGVGLGGLLLAARRNRRR